MVTSFVGRGREVAEVRDCLSAARLVTLTGPGGVGKTRLAIEVANDVQRVFPDGIWMVDLSTVQDDTLAAEALAAELQAGKHSTKPALEAVVEHLAGKSVLIVLDNCEHLAEVCAAMVVQLLRAGPALRLLATSRHILDVCGEHVFAVSPLAVPDPTRSLTADELLAYDSVRLLEDRARAARPGFAVTAQNSTDVASLCAGLEGIPLAIELAAARLRTVSVHELADRLTERFDLLAGTVRTELPRRRTLRKLIDWSYDLCSADERRMWARISMFRGGFDLAAAEQVCGFAGIDRGDVLGLLDALVARSIVTTVPSGNHFRFRMLEMLREYGMAQLTETDDHGPVEARHGEYCLQLARNCMDEWFGPGQSEMLARLQSDQQNLRAAFERFLASGDPGSALRMAAGLGCYWLANGLLSDGRLWLDQALAALGEQNAARAEGLWVAGWISLIQGDRDVALARLTECRSLAGRLPDPVAATQVESLLATDALVRGDAETALVEFTRVVDQLTALGATWQVGVAQLQLGAAQIKLGDLEGALATERDLIERCTERGEILTRSYAEAHISYVLAIDGATEAAREQAIAALRLQRGFHDAVCAGVLVEHLAFIAASCGQFSQAGQLLGAAHSIRSNAGLGSSPFGQISPVARATCERETLRNLGEAAFRAAFREGVQPSIAQAIEYALGLSWSANQPGPQHGLTRRERQVADLIVQGLSNRQIGERLVLSVRTVDGHVERLFAKLEVHSRAQVAAWVATNPA